MNYFLNSPPIIIKRVDSERVVIVTKYRIIYSVADNHNDNNHNHRLSSRYLPPFIASIHLVQPNPLQLKHSQQRQQSIVLTQSSIEIYTCDFIHEQVQLKKCIILNQQPVYSVSQSVGLKSWEIYGQVHQYSNSFIQLNIIESRSEQVKLKKKKNVLGKCFIDEFQVYYCEGSEVINIYDHKNETQHSASLKLPITDKLLLSGSLRNDLRSQLDQSRNCNNNNKRRSLSLKGWKLRRSYNKDQYLSGQLCSLGSQHRCKIKNDFVLIVEVDGLYLKALIPPPLQPQNRDNKPSFHTIMNLTTGIFRNPKRYTTINCNFTNYNNNNSNTTIVMNSTKSMPQKLKMMRSIVSGSSGKKWQAVNLLSQWQQHQILHSGLYRHCRKQKRINEGYKQQWKVLWILTRCQKVEQQHKESQETQQRKYFFHIIALNEEQTDQNGSICCQTYKLQLQQIEQQQQDYFSSHNSNKLHQSAQPEHQFINMLSQLSPKLNNMTQENASSHLNNVFQSLQLINIIPLLKNTPSSQSTNNNMTKLTFVWYDNFANENNNINEKGLLKVVTVDGARVGMENQQENYQHEQQEQQQQKQTTHQIQQNQHKQKQQQALTPIINKSTVSQSQQQPIIKQLQQILSQPQSISTLTHFDLMSSVNFINASQSTLINENNASNSLILVEKTHSQHSPRVLQLSTPHMAIPEVPQQQYNDDTTRFQHDHHQSYQQEQQHQSIQQIVQMQNFSSNILHLDTKNHHQRIKQQQQQKQQQQKQDQTESYKNQTKSQQQKQNQFYQKLIINQEETDLLQQSFDIDKHFRFSKVSCDSAKKKQAISKMIGGKDISQIAVNARNLSLQTDQCESLTESQVTVEIGEEVRKREDVDDDGTKRQCQKNTSHNNQECELFSKHSRLVQAEDDNNLRSSDDNTSNEQTVILIELGNSEQQSHSTTHNQKQQQRLATIQQQFIPQEKFIKLSRKVQQFCVDPQHLTYQKANEIQNKKYTQLMRQTYLRSEQRFGQLMKSFLPEIIYQQEARLFFAEYIRSFQGKTRDILVRLYMSLEESEQNKHFMSRALSEFKLSQVPQICLPIHKDILQIFKLLYPDVYVQDLLKPTIILLQKLLQSYFMLEKLPIDEITIQDELIDLSHPRNMLNVLLYLNEHYNLTMQQVFQTYCSVLIHNECSQIIVKMLLEERTFQICQVPKSILQDIVYNIFESKLRQSTQNIHWLQKSLQILDCNISNRAIQKKHQMQLILTVVDTLNLADCRFSMSGIFLLQQVRNLFTFCQTLIKENSLQNLNKLSLQKVYKLLYQIINNNQNHHQQLIYYNQQLKDLLEILAEKCFMNGEVVRGFQILAPIASISRRGFLAKMMFKYLGGRWINRLVKKEFKCRQQFVDVFNECFANFSSVNILSLPHDTFTLDPLHSYLTPPLPLHKFLSIYNQCIKSIRSQQIKYVCYMDYQLANELVTYHVIERKEWQALSDKLIECVPKEEIRRLNSKVSFCFDSKLLIANDQQQQYQQQRQLQDETTNQFKTIHQFNTKDPAHSFLNSITNRKSAQYHIKSLQSLKNNQTQQINTNNKKITAFRSNSHFKASSDHVKDCQHTPLLEGLRYEVDREAILKILRQLYECKQASSERTNHQKIQTFLKALSMIDRQRVHIHHYEKFKLIVNLDLDFNIEQLIPFDVLMQYDHKQCFELIIENGLKDKLELHNFWAVYMIVEMLIGEGESVAVVMVGKLLGQGKRLNIDYHQMIDKIMVGAKISTEKLMSIQTLLS